MGKCSLDFDLAKESIDAIFIVRSDQKKFLAKKRSYGWFLWILRRLSIQCPERLCGGLCGVVAVDEWIVNAIQGMSDGATTAVRLRDGKSKEF